MWLFAEVGPETFLRANCAAKANPNAIENVQPVATNRSLAESQTAFGCAVSDSSGERSTRTFTAANPKLLAKRQTNVLDE